MSRLRVGVAVVIRRKGDGYLLMGTRKGSRGAGTFSVPGGLLEYGETPLQAAIRETFEETGLELDPLDMSQGPYVSTVFDEGEREQHITLVYYASYFGDKKPKLMEPEKCEGWDWYPVDCLPMPQFPPFRNYLTEHGADFLM